MKSDTLIKENEGFLQWLDWLVIGIMLGASAGIGVYYRFTGGKQKTSEEYFSADRSTGITLLSVAIMVAFLSGLSLLGISAENYTYGAQFNLIYIGFILGTPIVAYFYLPVFYELQTMSVFEYLERRFGVTARLVGSFANFIQYGFFTGVVIYAPSLALEATTGLDGTISILAIGLICTFYSTIGGMKAVIITDLLQGALMFGCIFAIIGVVHINLDDGIGSVFDIAEKGGRMNMFKIEFDPTIRYSITACMSGTFLFLTQFAVNQVQVQRLLTARTLNDARKAFFINLPMTLLLVGLVSFSGLSLFAYYNQCDPVKAGKIKSYDMIMPYFAKEKMTQFPGLTGLFVSGIFSASLSTVSALLNSLAAVALSDYIKPLSRQYGHDITDEKAVFYGKLLALSIGCFSIIVAFLAAKIGSLIQVGVAINGGIGGPVLGLFTLGMFFESANETGAVIGTIVALILNMWISFTPKFRPPYLTMSIDKCINSSILNPQMISTLQDETAYSYIDRLSFLWYTTYGMSCVLIVGLIASVIINNLTNTPLRPLEANLFTPFVAARIRKRREKNMTIVNSQVFVLDIKNSITVN